MLHSPSIPMIRLKNITIRKGGLTLFERFSLDIKSGENFVIGGRNGSGKTILLELIAGHHTPVEGNIEYDFISADDWQERHSLIREYIHFIPTHALQVFLTGFHELFYQQRYYSVGSTVPLVREVLGETIHSINLSDFPLEFKIDKLLDLELTRLSNGQLKKVLILKNLLKKIPKVLLLDYPFEGLDRESRLTLMKFIDHLAGLFQLQVILSDHHHELPPIINYALTLDNFKLKKKEQINRHAGIHTISSADQSLKRTRINTGDTILEMRGLTIQYGQTRIIDNLNWIVKKGERWALTGRNGSGKTTLFSLIYADHPMAYSQPVFLFGRRRGTGESIWDIKKRINYLGPEQIHFMNPKSITATAYDYILDETSLGRKRFNELIEFFEAQNYIHKPVRVLSSGQLQMVSLLRFFLTEKELLLLDEPFQFLDPVSKEKVTDYLGKYLNSDVTLILITHYEEDLTLWTHCRLSL